MCNSYSYIITYRLFSEAYTKPAPLNNFCNTVGYCTVVMLIVRAFRIFQINGLEFSVQTDMVLLLFIYSFILTTCAPVFINPVQLIAAVAVPANV